MGLADVANAERIEEAVERDHAACVDGIEQVTRRSLYAKTSHSRKGERPCVARLQREDVQPGAWIWPSVKTQARSVFRPVPRMSKALRDTKCFNPSTAWAGQTSGSRCSGARRPLRPSFRRSRAAPPIRRQAPRPAPGPRILATEHARRRSFPAGKQDCTPLTPGGDTYEPSATLQIPIGRAKTKQHAPPPAVSPLPWEAFERRPPHRARDRPRRGRRPETHHHSRHVWTVAPWSRVALKLL